MNDRLKRWLSTVASQLDLRAEQKAVVLEELQAHVQADLADRLREGLSGEEAINATLAEMGDPKPVAAELNRVHNTETSLVRTLLGVQIMLLGLFGSIGATGAMKVQPQVADQLPGLSRWIAQHEMHVLPLLLVAVSFMVGYVARKNGWKCALLPVVGLYGAFTLVGLAAGIKPRLDVAGAAALAITVLAVLGGAHLGTKLARLASPYRRALFALFAGTVGLCLILGLALIILSFLGRSTGSRVAFSIVLLVMVSPGALALGLLARHVRLSVRWE